MTQDTSHTPQIAPTSPLPDDATPASSVSADATVASAVVENLNPARRTRLSPEDRRARILEAATTEFATYGFEGVPIAQIAGASGCSLGLLYRYFANKADLYNAVVDAVLSRSWAKHEEIQAAFPEGTSRRDRVQAFIQLYLDEVEDHPESWRNLLTGSGGAPAESTQLLRDMRTKQSDWLSGLFPDRTDARFAYAVPGLFGMLEACALEWGGRGFPDAERWPIIMAILDGFQGAIGDWGSGT